MTQRPSRPPSAQDSGAVGEASGTTVCPIHNLRYPSQQAEGCVLCRRSASPPSAVGARELTVPTTWIAAALSIAVGIAAFYALRPTPDRDEVVPAAAMLWGTKSDYALCGHRCARAHQECEDQCSERTSAAPGCSQYCFDEVDGCFAECTERYQKVDYAWSYYYGTETMPEWSEVLVGSAELGKRLMACSEEPVVALAYVEVSEAPSPTNAVLVSAKGQPPGVTTCVNTALSATPFPASPFGEYAFLARFDGRHDRLKLAIEQAKVELEAAPRKRPKPELSPTQARLFDTQVAVSKQSGNELAKQNDRLRAERATLDGLKRELEVRRAYQQRSLPLQPPITPEQQAKLDAAAADKQRRDDERRARAIAADAARKNRDELERYRSINNRYRQREQSVRQQRQWDSFYERRR